MNAADKRSDAVASDMLNVMLEEGAVSNLSTVGGLYDPSHPARNQRLIDAHDTSSVSTSLHEEGSCVMS